MTILSQQEKVLQYVQGKISPLVAAIGGVWKAENVVVVDFPDGANYPDAPGVIIWPADETDGQNGTNGTDEIGRAVSLAIFWRPKIQKSTGEITISRDTVFKLRQDIDDMFRRQTQDVDNTGPDLMAHTVSIEYGSIIATDKQASPDIRLSVLTLTFYGIQTNKP